MLEAPFRFIELTPRRSQRKPRTSGLTMVIDNGMPLGHLRDWLGIAARYIDLAKIKTGTSRLYDEGYLREKLALYKAHGIRPFIGGQFQEFVFATQGPAALPRFLQEARRVGFEVVEVSDNVVPLSPKQRREQIGMAIAEGLAVFGEVGSKDNKTDAATLVAQAEDCFAAGAELVLVEAAELIENGRPNRELIDALRRSIDVTRALIELPGPWISGAHACDIEDLKKFLVREFGPDANMANVQMPDIIDLEALRVGIGTVGPPEELWVRESVA